MIGTLCELVYVMAQHMGFGKKYFDDMLCLAVISGMDLLCSLVWQSTLDSLFDDRSSH